MYKQNPVQKTTIQINTSYQGETIEDKINRIVNNKEPITDGAPLVYTDRKDGVLPEYDIKTDRFEIAIDAMDKVSKSHIAQRENRIGQKAMEGMTEEQKAEYVKDKPNVKYTPPKKADEGKKDG